MECNTLKIKRITTNKTGNPNSKSGCDRQQQKGLFVYVCLVTR